MLSYEDDDGLPLLVTAKTRSPRQWQEQRLQYEKSDATEDPPALTPVRYTAQTVLPAHTLGFALLYRQENQVLSRQHMPRMSQLVPALVDFADAYGLLERLSRDILAMLFLHSSNGYDAVAENPFQMLRAAFKLESQRIYADSMKHAVAIHHVITLSEDEWKLSHNVSYFSDAADDTLQQDFDKAAQAHSVLIERMIKSLFVLNPNHHALNVIDRVGMAIYRDWIVQYVVNMSLAGLHVLQTSPYDIAKAVFGWCEERWHNRLKLDTEPVFYHVQSCFKKGQTMMKDDFPASEHAHGKQSVQVYAEYHNKPISYLANLGDVWQGYQCQWTR
jgi:hypothetical protein